MAIRLLRLFLLLCCLLGDGLAAQPAWAQTAQQGTVQYRYDKDGRLTGVTNGDGSVTTYQYDAANNLIKVTNSATATFAITGFSPASGAAGTTVTIVGTGFSNPTVSFNGAAAAVGASTATSITATVPTGATTGPLTVKVGSQTSTAGTFTVLSGAPVSTIFSSPVAQRGDTITLSGSGFDPTAPGANTVTLNIAGIGTETATVSAVNATQITFTVPSGSSIPPNPPNANFSVPSYPGTAATVTVQTAGGTATVPKPLYLVPRVAFRIAGVPGGAANGSLSAYGDNGLVTFPGGGQTNFTLDVGASAVNGSGYLTVLVFNPDNTLVQSVRVNATPFGNLSNGSFQGTVPGIDLSAPGLHVIQSFFEYDTSRGFQATGNISFGSPPVLTRFSVPVAAPGDTISLSGNGFNTSSPSANTVTVAGVSATVSAVTDGQISFVVPQLPASSDPQGTAAAVVVNSGATATAPQPLYVVPRIAFRATGVAGNNVTGTLSNPGDTGLISIASGGSNSTLSINATGVTGSGSLKLYLYRPDGTLQQTYTVPPNGFQLSNGSFTTTLYGLDLSTSGSYYLQTAFAPTTGQVSGSLKLGIDLVNTNTLKAFSVFNPGFTSTGSVTLSEQAALDALSVFNPGPTGSGTVTLSEQKASDAVSVFNPNSSNTGTTTLSGQAALDALSVFNPSPTGSGTVTLSSQKAGDAASVFNPGSSTSGTVTLSEQKAVDLFSLFNPAPTSTGVVTLTQQKALTQFSVCNPQTTTCP